jgi:hypothetical protein
MLDVLVFKEQPEHCEFKGHQTKLSLSFNDAGLDVSSAVEASSDVKLMAFGCTF